MQEAPSAALASWDVCLSAAAGAEASEKRFRGPGCLCPRLAPSTSPRRVWNLLPGPGPGGAQGVLDASGECFLFSADGCSWPILKVANSTQMPGPPCPSPRPLRSLGSDSSHPPGTSLVLTSPPQPFTPTPDLMAPFLRPSLSQLRTLFPVPLLPVPVRRWAQ